MIQNLDLQKIIFLDIETVPLEYNFKDLPKKTIDLWDKKTKYIQKYQEINAEEAYSKSGIYAEFAKIVCISAGYITKEGKKLKLRVTVELTVENNAKKIPSQISTQMHRVQEKCISSRECEYI